MKNPVIYILPEAKRKLDLYIAACKWEISGLGAITKVGNDFLIEDVFLFEQEVSGGSTELSQKDIHKFLVQCIKDGVDPGKLRLWFHSHVNMEAYWSGTDDSTIDGFKSDYLISIVGNKRGDYVTRIDVYDPIRLKSDNLKLQVHLAGDDALAEKIKAEIAEKVTYSPIIHVGSGYGYGSDYDWEKQDDNSWKRVTKSAKDTKKFSKRRALVVVDADDVEDDDDVIDDKLPCNGCEELNCHECTEEWIGV